MQDFNRIDVRPMTGALGAEIHGVDLSSDLDESLFAEIREAYYRYGVIFFRDQTLTPEQHIRFARRWGEININRFFKPADGYPMIAQVLKEPGHVTNTGGDWHTDHSYDETPAMGSILYALEVPEVGGDTLFASMAKAYETLSEGMKNLLAGLKAVHSSRHVFGAQSERLGRGEDERYQNAELATQDAVHPLVLTHPITGQRLLYVNSTFTVGIEGWRQEESQPLLAWLNDHGARPEMSCRFRWEKGSVAFWDNLATWHLALNDYPGQRRHMHRITIEGTPLT